MRAMAVKDIYNSIASRGGARDSGTIVITSYALREGERDSTHLAAVEWQAIVLDEAHVLKNSATKRFAVVSALRARCRVLLTGTPVQQNVDEFVSLLRLILPRAYGHIPEFLVGLSFVIL